MVIEIKNMVDAERGLVDRSIFTDQEIYQQELEKIFTRAWLFIGHDSLVPNPNDFFTTYMGEDPVILTRDAKGALHAMLNMCRHRGNRVVRADDGNAKNFMCTYHGWTYSSDGGKLVSVPGLQEAYYGELDVDNLGLIEVGRLDTYAGLIFATWDAEAPSLEDYLGDMRWYMDTFFNRLDGGLDLVGPEKWNIPNNWKMSADNFAGDNYHIAITHRSATIARAKARGQTAPATMTSFATAANGFCVDPGNGHGMSGRWPNPQQGPNQAFTDPKLGEYRQAILPEMERRLGAFRVNGFTPTVSTIFPNMSFLFGNGTVRMWHPRGPYHTEIWSFMIEDKTAPQEIRDLQRTSSMRIFGVSGIFEQDDMDNWNQCTTAGKSLMARKVAQYVAMGLGHEEVEGHEELAGHLFVSNHISELNQRNLYARWQEFMQAESWRDVSTAPRTAKYEGTATFKG